MNFLRTAGLRTAVAGLCFVLLPLWAAAQQPGTPSTPAQTTKTEPGRLVLERVQNGPVFAPDFKFTQVDGKFANLAGAYAGWLSDNRFLIGGAGYFLTNRSRDFKMAYGGLIVEWFAIKNNRAALGVKGLVGVGTATLSSPLSQLINLPDDYDSPVPYEEAYRPGPPRPGYRPGTDGQTRVVFNEDFFIAEPQATLSLGLTRQLRLNWGVGYRLIGRARGLDDRLRGVSGSVGLQIGGGS